MIPVSAGTNGLLCQSAVAGLPQALPSVCRYSQAEVSTSTIEPVERMSIPQELVADIDRLEPLPVTLQALVGKLDDDFVSPREIARLVEYDQAMVAALLRAANSAALGGRIKVERVADAVMRLGIDQILAVVLGSHFRKLTGSLGFYDLSEDDLWYHAAVASLAAKDLMVACPGAGIPAAAPVAALLHDIGKLVLVRHADADTGSVLALVAGKNMTFIDAEREVLGFDHCEVGAAMADRWELPEEITHVIARHHTVPVVEASPLLDAVMVANMVAKTIGAGLGAECVNLPNDPEVLRRLGMGFPDFSRLCSGVISKAGELRELYGLAPAP